MSINPGLYRVHVACPAFGGSLNGHVTVMSADSPQPILGGDPICAWFGTATHTAAGVDIIIDTKRVAYLQGWEQVISSVRLEMTTEEINKLNQTAVVSCDGTASCIQIGIEAPIEICLHRIDTQVF